MSDHPETVLDRIELRTVVGILLAMLIAVAMASYGLFQARFLIMGPQIVVNEAIAPAQSERVVTLSGAAFNITHLWLNDRPIYTDEQGYFKEDIVLPNGYTIVTLRAKDRYGRETKVERPFVYITNELSYNN